MTWFIRPDEEEHDEETGIAISKAYEEGRIAGLTSLDSLSNRERADLELKGYREGYKQAIRDMTESDKGNLREELKPK